MRDLQTKWAIIWDILRDLHFSNDRQSIKTLDVINVENYTYTHCSYLAIYISQIYYTYFSSIFCRNCQIYCFLHTVTAIPKRLIYLSHVFVSNHNSNISTPWNSSDSVQKAVDLTTPAKNRRKVSIKDLNFQIKKFMDLACRLV